MAELLDVLHRLRLTRFLDPGLRSELVAPIYTFGVFFTPTISSDADLLVLHPWRGLRILRPVEYLALVGEPP